MSASRVASKSVAGSSASRAPSTAKLTTAAKTGFTEPVLFEGINDAAMGGVDNATSEARSASLTSRLLKVVADTKLDVRFVYEKNILGRRIYALIGDLSDEGFRMTLFTADGKQLATGDTYRSELPDWEAK